MTRLEPFGASEADSAGAGQEDPWGQSHRADIWSQEEENECTALNCVPKIHVHLQPQNVTSEPHQPGKNGF